MKCCNRCNKPNCCGDCCSAPCQKEHFSIEADPYDPQTWFINGNRVRVPKAAETCTSLTTNVSSATLNYTGECGKDTITGRQLGQLIKLDDLRDVEAEHPDSCSILAWNPHCDYCAEGCQKIGSAWEPYVIPDAGNNVLSADSQGYYHVLAKTDCGCPVERKIPVVPQGALSINYLRDSVPDDPDFPWYYGCYNDTIHLHLQANAPQYFNKYDLKVTINYGVQAIKSHICPNYNFRSLIVPVVNGEDIRVTRMASILQANCTSTQSDSQIPWGSVSLRGAITLIVPKGKEAYLHHEMRIRTKASFPEYDNGSWDGNKVPDNEIALNSTLHPTTRLNALQVLVEPIQGVTHYDAVTDTVRSQLDSGTKNDDVYPPIQGV